MRDSHHQFMTDFTIGSLTNLNISSQIYIQCELINCEPYVYIGVLLKINLYVTYFISPYA